MTARLLTEFLGWLPLWLILRLAGHPIRAGRLLLAGALTAFVAGMCCNELRRYGFLGASTGEFRIPLLDLHFHEVGRFFLLGASAGLVGDYILDRLRVRPLGGSGSQQ